MVKYIDAEKLIVEIRRLIKVNQELKSDHFTEGIAAGYGDVLSAIDSLQQEGEQEVDLEKIIEQTYHDGSVADTDDMDHIDYRNIARYFFELGLSTKK